MANKAAFLAEYAPAAQAEQARSGIPASVILAQLIEESGWDLSGLAREAKNLFGIKADKSWKGAVKYTPTGEYINGNYTTVVAAFRKYDSYEDSFADHTKFLQENKRYAQVFQTNDPFQVAKELQAAGYATNPSYAENLSKIIRDNNLTQYDTPGGATMRPSATDGGAQTTTAGWASDAWDKAGDIRKSLTPGWLWDILQGKNPKDVIEDGLKGMAQKWITTMFITLLLIVIVFLIYKVITSKGG